MRGEQGAVLPQRADIVIIGAGFAGAAIAWSLARRGATDIVILERESVPGFHSSGRNAAFIRSTTADGPNCWFAQQTLEFLKSPPDDYPGNVEFIANGHLSLAGPAEFDELQRELDAARGHGLPADVLDRDQLVERVPVLADSPFERGVFNPDDGVVDIHQFLQGFLRGARQNGARLLLDTVVTGVVSEQGRVVGVQTNRGRIDTGLLVNGAGAWAGGLGEMAGAANMPLKPCRRHLMTTPALDWVDPDWPMVWTVNNQFYFRPESGGLLMSGCDVDPMPACDPITDYARLEQLAERMTDKLPHFDRVSIRKAWACLRTLTPDDRFIIGFDPQVDNFFWAAGLGGHGVSGSVPLGELAADLILDQQRIDFDAEICSPLRFTRS